MTAPTLTSWEIDWIIARADKASIKANAALAGSAEYDHTKRAQLEVTAGRLRELLFKLRGLR